MLQQQCAASGLQESHARHGLDSQRYRAQFMVQIHDWLADGTRRRTVNAGTGATRQTAIAAPRIAYSSDDGVDARTTNAATRPLSTRGASAATTGMTCWLGTSLNSHAAPSATRDSGMWTLAASARGAPSSAGGAHRSTSAATAAADARSGMNSCGCCHHLRIAASCAAIPRALRAAVWQASSNGPASCTVAWLCSLPASNLAACMKCSYDHDRAADESQCTKARQQALTCPNGCSVPTLASAPAAPRQSCVTAVQPFMIAEAPGEEAHPHNP